MTLIGIKNVVWLGGGKVVSALFDSMYETFNALTSILPQHFVEWFSGSVIDTIWTEHNIVGTGVYAMQDAVDEGFSVGVVASNNQIQWISFNNKRQYEPTGCVIIGVVKRVSAVDTNQYEFGFRNNATASGNNETAYVKDQKVASFISLTTGDASANSEIASDVATNTNFHTHKIDCGSANIKLTIDGVLKVTKTTNRPTAKLQPYFGMLNGGTETVTSEGHIRYLECFNTDVAILSTLYERLFALTEIMKQRFVETFSGSVLNDRWLTNSQVGTPTFAMADAVDGGFEIVTGAEASSNGDIDFNDIRQFSPTNSVGIFVSERVDTNLIMTIGMANAGGAGANHMLFINSINDTFINLSTNDGSAGSKTNSDITDTNSRIGCELEASSADIKMTLDGVLKVTKTTNRPTAKMQAVFSVASRIDNSTKTGRITYYEAYNKGTTPLVDSVFELFNELTTVAKQHVWEWFSGSVLHNKWTTNNVQGTNTFQMADVVDGGFEIITGTTANDDGSINFNDKRQYDFNASIIIFVMQQITAASYRCQAGFSDSNNLPSGDSAYIDNNTDFTNYRLLTFRLGGGAATNTDIAKDLLVHSFKVETKASSVEGSMDGVLKATNTTNLPAVKMQPIFEVRTLTTAAKTGRIRYLEARNT